MEPGHGSFGVQSRAKNLGGVVLSNINPAYCLSTFALAIE
jgi:hypothetical protein